MTEVLLTVIGVAFSAAGAWAMWQKRRAVAPSDAIRLVSTRHLGGKRFLTLVEVDGERLLLGVSDEQVSLVTRLGSARTVAVAEVVDDADVVVTP